MKKVLLVLTIIAFSGMAHADEYYYKVAVSTCGKGCVKYFSGKSDLSPKEMEKELSKNSFIELTDIFYFEKGKLKSWIEWDDKLVPQIKIRASSIITYMLYNGNPKKNAQ